MQEELLSLDGQLAEGIRQERARFEETAGYKRDALQRLREGATLNEAQRAKQAETRAAKLRVRPLCQMPGQHKPNIIVVADSRKSGAVNCYAGGRCLLRRI
jgi:hypothetical protein